MFWFDPEKGKLIVRWGRKATDPAGDG